MTAYISLGVVIITSAIILPLIVIIFRKRRKGRIEKHIYEEPSLVILQNRIEMSSNVCYENQQSAVGTLIMTTNPVYNITEEFT